MNALEEAFKNKKFQRLVQQDIPSLIEKADAEALKYGKTGMEMGSVRKKHIIDFFIKYFGEKRVELTSSGQLGMDFKIDSIPIKIKTITGMGGVKITWTTDKDKLEIFISDYKPVCGILLIRINWEMKEKNQPSGMFWIPIEVQMEILKQLSVENYLTPPKRGINSRGVPISKKALEILLKNKETKHVDINWRLDK